MNQPSPSTSKMASLALAAVLALSLTGAAFAAGSPVAVTDFGSLRDLLEAPGTAQAAISVESVVVDTEDTITVAGHKTLTIGPECALEVYGVIDIPEGASLTIDGGGYTHVEVYDGYGFGVEGSLHLSVGQVQLFAGGNAAAVVNFGGELTLRDSVLLMSLAGNAVGIQNEGTFTMDNGLFYLASQGFEQGYISVGFHNDGGTATLRSVVTNLVNMGSSAGIVNTAGEMRFLGGTVFLGNYYASIGISNGDGMQFGDVALYLDSSGQSGIDNMGGTMAFTGCTLEFLSPEGSAANLYNREGSIDIGSSAIVVYTDGEACIENASGTVRDSGGNSLLRISGADVLVSHDGATLDNWADTYYYLRLDVIMGGRSYVNNTEVYALKSAWPGHVVYLIQGDQLVPVTPIRTRGETITVTAEGFQPTRQSAPALENAQPGATLTVVMAETTNAGIYLGILTLVLAIAGVFGQQKYGKTFQRPVKKTKVA